MRLLITGGAGFVALALAEAALEAGHSVVLLDLLDPPAPARRVFARFGERCLLERGDVLEGEAVADLIARHRIDTVAHAAAVTAGPDRERRAPESIASVNLLGTIAVIGAARAARVRRFLQFATGSAYGAVPVEAGPIDEDATPLRPVSLYGITKAAAERTASRLDELDPFNLVIARLGPVFGPWEWATGMRDTLSPMFQATRLAVEGGEAVLDGEARTDWIYSRDIARGLLVLLEAERPRRKVYNIGAGTRWPASEWCARLAEIYPGFRWRLAASGDAPTVATTPLRAPLSTRRMAEEFGFAARFPGTAGFADHRAWMDEVGKEFVLG